MNNLMYIPFFLFIIAAYIYYQRKEKKQEQFFIEERNSYIRKNPELPEEKSQNLLSGIPWTGMDTATLVSLFGEPRRKRVLDGSMTRLIWSYSDIFIYIDREKVIEWKKK